MDVTQNAKNIKMQAVLLARLNFKIKKENSSIYLHSNSRPETSNQLLKNPKI